MQRYQIVSYDADINDIASHDADINDINRESRR